MNTISKDIIEKVRQLSDLLIVIKESGNNTPQILKELAVEKCSEIYNLITSTDDVIDTVNNITLEGCVETTCETDIDGNVENIDDNEEEIVSSDIELEEVEEKEEQIMEEETPFNIETEPAFENENSEIEDEEEYNNESDTEELDLETEVENTLLENEEVKNITFTEDFDDNKDISFEEEDEIIIIGDEEKDDDDMFMPKEEYKKCNHKKIRSLLSINDIFLYKRELFGNSDVDMTDMFDGIDEANSFDDAMEIISEYFGNDINTEELVKEFIDRVKQCFE